MNYSSRRMVQPRLCRLSSLQILAHRILFPVYTLDTFAGRKLLPYAWIQIIYSKFREQYF